MKRKRNIILLNYISGISQKKTRKRETTKNKERSDRNG